MPTLPPIRLRLAQTRARRQPRTAQLYGKKHDRIAKTLPYAGPDRVSLVLQEDSMAIGFIGLGVMGEPMALNLARAGVHLLVWNRSPGAGEKLRTAGATVAATPSDLFA